MDLIKNTIHIVTDNNVVYIFVGLIAVVIGIKITQKLVKLIMGLIFIAYTLLKFAISNNLINLATLIQ